jgi:hypothetical protein
MFDADIEIIQYAAAQVLEVLLYLYFDIVPREVAA